MSFLSSEGLKKITPPPIEPFDRKNIKHGAYELSVGNEHFCTSKNTKKTNGAGKQIEIPPGQFALLISDEIVNIPNNLIAFISFKAGTKFRGLINVSGFHVDPGFYGRLKFSVYNAGSQTIILDPGQPLFLIWFCSLDQATDDVYNGDHKNQMKITAADVMKINGTIASPASLKIEIDSLRNKFYVLLTVGLIVFSSLLPNILNNVLNLVDSQDKTMQKETVVKNDDGIPSNINKNTTIKQNKLDSDSTEIDTTNNDTLK